MRRLSRRDRGLDYHAPIHCVEHQVDLAAVQRFVGDGRPEGGPAAVEAITGGECPACRPRYVAAWQCEDAADAAIAVAAVDAPVDRLRLEAGGPARTVSPVSCACCRTCWELEDTGWVATVDGGLQITGQPEPIPAGKVIDSSWFVVEPVNGVEGPEQALRSAFVAFDESAPHRAVDDLVDDVTLSMAAAYDGTADEEAELGRITLEHDLDEAASERWQSVALAALAAVRGLLGDDMGPASPLSPTRAGIEVSRERFGELVVEALDSIPPELARRMENVAVIVEDEAEGGRLFGLYRGVPLTKRTGYGHAVPDLITIYQTTISQYSDTESEIVAQVRRTVIHEVAHHFGISDPRLRELGW